SFAAGETVRARHLLRKSAPNFAPRYIRQCSVLRRRASILAFPPCTIQAGSADSRAAVIRPTGAADAPY
ncbi:hypothetical protein RF541_28975, partial [Pseudomonas aeruginosa]